MQRAFSSVVLFVLAVGCGVVMADEPPDEDRPDLQLAAKRGWRAEYLLGEQLVADLAAGGFKQTQATANAIGRRVAFIGTSSPGANFKIDEGFEVRLVDLNGREFSLHNSPNVSWQYLFRGKVRSIDVKKKLI